MNPAINHIKRIDAAIKTLDKEIASGNIHAAGITLEMTVGVKDEDTCGLVMSFGIYSDLNAILGTIRQGLVDSRAQWVKNAKSDLAELDAFLNWPTPL